MNVLIYRLYRIYQVQVSNESYNRSSDKERFVFFFFLFFYYRNVQVTIVNNVIVLLMLFNASMKKENVIYVQTVILN